MMTNQEFAEMRDLMSLNDHYRALFQYTRRAVSSAVREIRSAEYEGAVGSLMNQRADELLDHLNAIEAALD